MSIVYRRITRYADKFVPERFQPFWNHQAGPKTVHFWAPVIKWGLVVAGLSDISRPAEQLSVAQSSALMATGAIWSRYSLVIIPKNWGLFSVNMFVAATGFYQTCRAVRYHVQEKQSQEKDEIANNVLASR
ncbi:mitochondrial pyruvate carrier 2-like [Rhodnius prolixus]|uniref:Mitochondrial pyruvate carrier n=2 Tax=Rhodnius TaxID=13248 RepID=R4FLU8_RHOPR